MKQFLTVLKFELNNYFKNKSFVLTTILLMVLAVGIIGVPGIIMSNDSDSDSDSGKKDDASFRLREKKK